jgi:Zinc-binding dehydrogenase
VRELTAGRGVDCVVEISARETIAMSLKALAVGGHVSLIGASLSQSEAGLDPLFLTGRGNALGSIGVGSRADFEAMNRAIEIHRVHPVIDRTFKFDEAKGLYRHFEGRAILGRSQLLTAEDWNWFPSEGRGPTMSLAPEPITSRCRHQIAGFNGPRQDHRGNLSHHQFEPPSRCALDSMRPRLLHRGNSPARPSAPSCGPTLQ